MQQPLPFITFYRDIHSVAECGCIASRGTVANAHLCRVHEYEKGLTKQKEEIKKSIN